MRIDDSIAQRPRVPSWLWPSLFLSALLSLYSISMRVSVESGNRATSLSAEMETVEALSAAEGRTVDDSLRNLRLQGVNSIVLSEETIADLLQQGRASLADGRLTLIQNAGLSSTIRVDALAERVKRGLQLRFTNLSVSEERDGANVVLSFPPDTPVSMIRTTAIGLNPLQATEAKKAGMALIARASNPPGVSGAYVEGTVRWMVELGAKVFLPQGDQVLGRREAIGTFIDSLKQYGMLYATPEFTKIGGDANVVDKLPEQVIRLHSAQAAELDKMPYEDAVDRYAKASRERNMRILLLRPVTFAADKPLAAFAQFAKDVNEQIQKNGGAVGFPKAFRDSGVPTWLKLLIALSMLPAAWFAGSTLVRPPLWRIVGIGLLALVCLASVKIGFGYAALAASIVFPVTAFLVLDSRNGRSPFVEFLATTLVSMFGGFAVAGMLNGLPYFVKAAEFQGIKLAVFLPILLAMGWFFARFMNVREELRKPMTWLGALAALGLLAALAFMSARTGNDNPAGVSDLELKMRNVLDALLFVRPRTKSFLIGHPALYIGIAMMLWQRRRGEWSWPVLTALMLTVGMIGQTDVVNTFCHLHTPFMLSLVRTGVGIVPGVILGGAAWWLVSRRLDQGRTTKHAT